MKKNYVSMCIFVPKHNFFIVSVLDKASKTSRFEIHIFQKTGIIKDQYLLKLQSRTTGSIPVMNRSTALEALTQ
jgi:hypothetical protein